MEALLCIFAIIGFIETVLLFKKLDKELNEKYSARLRRLELEVFSNEFRTISK